MVTCATCGHPGAHEETIALGAAPAYSLLAVP